ncbi:thermonuclease family protein [Candidatus Saccharibacteria bacterium]|nr:thermonuclease family protein [Candidatus Saccharibacteria bacterium]
MSRRHSSIFTGLILTVAMAFSGTFGVFNRPAAAATFPVYYVLGFWANSADTILVALNGKITKVRMIGIDAPEATSRANTKKGCYAAQAKTVVKKLVAGKFVRLESDPKMPDKYTDGSLLRYVYINGNQDIGATLVYNGAAKEYMYQHKNYTYRSWYKSLENTAVSRSLGLWNPRICPMNR